MSSSKLTVRPESVHLPELLDVVSSAASQDPALIQAATDRLKKMWDMYGIHEGIHAIAARRDLPLNVRQMAIIQFKNKAVPNWRSRKVTDDEQRSSIRSRTFMFLDEQDETIAECNEYIVARIARMDYPNQWGSLIPDLMKTIDNSLQARYGTPVSDPHTTLVLKRSLRILHAILKEFQNAKLLNMHKSMEQLASQLHQVLYGYYTTFSGVISSSLNTESMAQVRTAEDFLFARLIFKCIAKIATWHWHRTASKSDTLNTWVEELFRNAAVQLNQLVTSRVSLVTSLRPAQASPALEQFTRHIRAMGKFFRRLQQLKASQFVQLPHCRDLVLFYWDQVVRANMSSSDLTADSMSAVYPVRFLVQAMVIFKESLAQWTPFKKNAPPEEDTLSLQFVRNAVELLVTRFIPLRKEDLELWSEDPEEWVNLEDKESDQWEFELRPCSERVLTTFAQKYPDYVVPLLVEIWAQTRLQQPPTDLDGVIRREAFYCAIGRCASFLKGHIDWDSWLAQNLVVEIKDPNPAYPIIKRRIAWLIGRWIYNECAPANNRLLWEVLKHLLCDHGPGTDTVVRLTAAVALRECVDSLTFDINVFEEFLAPTVAALVALTAEADILESKRRISNSLITVIERAERRIVPLAESILSPVPELWTASGEDWLMKSTLLTTVTILIQAVKEQSMPFIGPIVIPLLRESLSPGAISHLDDDALALWIKALQNATVLEGINGAPGLIDVFPIINSLLSTNADLLGKITTIHESYYILNGQLVLQGYAVEMFGAYVAALGNSPPSLNVKDMMIALNFLFQSQPSSLWGGPLHVSGLFSMLFSTLIDVDTSMPANTLTEYIYVLARIAMADTQLFAHLITITAPVVGKPERDLWDALMDQWWRKFDNMSEPRHRKLTAMGVAAFVSTGRPEVLKRLQGEVFNLWLDVFGEIREIQENAADESNSSLTRYWDQNEAPEWYYRGSEDTPEYERRKHLYATDPVQSYPLRDYVKAALAQAEAVTGPAFQSVYLKDFDPTVKQQIERELA